MRSFLAAILFFMPVSVFSKDISILSFGAKADTKTMNTRYIQAAIDKCSKSGDRVIIPSGTFLSGTLFLKEGVKLFLMPGAVLLGSGSFSDYPEIIQAPTNQRRRALIYGNKVNHIAILGTGTINGNGGSTAFQLGDDSGPKGNQGRPMLILMVDCIDIRIENLNLKNSAFWMQSYVGCENLYIKGVNIYNHANFNNDAIDIDSRNVLIEDCIIDSDDDGLCLKSHDKKRPCENVTIRNCVVSSNCNAIKFGTASKGGFRNIDISNITIRKASIDRIRKWQDHLEFIEQPITVIAGIAIENVDGGITDNITINNIFMSDVQTPIFIKFGNRQAAKLKDRMPLPLPGRMRNIILSNITATSHSKITSSITGFPGYDIENLQLHNIIISSMGNGTARDAAFIPPENEKSYPENRMFGFVLPSSGLYIRHVKGISIHNVVLSTRNKDNRTTMIMDDVKDAQISLFNIGNTEILNSIIKLVNCQNINWFNPQAKSFAKPLLQVEGNKTSEIYITGVNQLNKNNIIRSNETVLKGSIIIN